MSDVGNRNLGRLLARPERAPSGRDDNNAGSQKSDQARASENSNQDSAEEVGEDAEVATAAESNSSQEATSAPPPDDDGYVWPEGAEVAPEKEAGAATTAAEALRPLPSLDELVNRIPPDVRETLDDLFRVKYVSVKRVAASSLKS